MNFNNIKCQILSFFDENKVNIIIFGCLFFVGILTGIITICQLKNTFGVEKISDIVLRQSICGGVNFFSYFFRRLLDYIIAGVFSFVLCLCFYTSFLNYAVMFYRGYVFGSTIAMCIVLFGLGGAINVVLFYLPFQIILNFVLICFVSECMHMSASQHRYGRGCKLDFWFVWLYLILIFILCLLEAIFLPPLLKSIIYVV